MQGVTGFHGYDVVQPLGELAGGMRECFGDPTLWSASPGSKYWLDGIAIEELITAWFSFNEQERKECIRQRDGGRCFITGEESCIVHEFATRGANASAALVPWNMAVVSSKIHDLLHRGAMKVVSFDPQTETVVIYGVDGHLMRSDDIWLFQRGKAEHLQQVEARIQGLAMIEGDVARDLYELSKGYKLLEPDAVSFSQYIAGRNVSATKATQAARAYGWMEDYALVWPTGLTSEKADIIRKAMDLTLAFTDHTIAEKAQAFLDAAVDQSVSDLKQELIDEGLMKASVRWYVHIRTKTASNPVIDGQIALVRARSVDEALGLSTPLMWDLRGGHTSMVLRADKFVAGLNWDRKTRVLSGRDGNEIPYKDLT